MNAQKSKDVLRKSLYLQDMVDCMSYQEKMLTADIIKGCDIARLLKSTTIHQELKIVRDQNKGKIKRFLSALAKNPYTLSGVDVLFERGIS